MEKKKLTTVLYKDRKTPRPYYLFLTIQWRINVLYRRFILKNKIMTTEIIVKLLINGLKASHAPVSQLRISENFDFSFVVFPRGSLYLFSLLFRVEQS